MTGTHAPITVLSRDDAEVDKRITSLLLRAAPVILFDNVEYISSTALAAAITSPIWAGRELGVSKVPHVPNCTFWLATGNNVELSSEFARRTALIRLDAQEQRPESRLGFKHKDIISWAKANRRELVRAALSIIQSWLDAGSPLAECHLGRFETWKSHHGWHPPTREG